MVGTTALVAGWADTAGKAATATIAAETSTRDRDAATKSRAAGVGRGSAGADVVTELAAVVATAISSGATDAECRAVGLHVAQALAVVALLGFCRARQRAFAGLVVGLLAVVAKPVGRSASLGVMAELTAFVACATRERRHLDCLAEVNNNVRPFPDVPDFLPVFNHVRDRRLLPSTSHRTDNDQKKCKT